MKENVLIMLINFFFFKQKTAYEIPLCDWSSDVCSSDLQAVGRSAPWFVLAVMLFSFAVRSVYLESCSMYVRGGVYVVVRDAMGPFLARLSVSALIFDYILTGPISAVSAGQYLGRVINEISEMLQSGMTVSPNEFAAAFGLLV